MVDFFDKVVKFFPKLDNYYILHKEEERIIVGTSVIIKKHKEFTENVFMPLTKITDEKINTCFLITIAERAAPLDKLFIEQKLPLLSIKNKKGIGSLDQFKELLNNFVKNNYYDN